LIATSEEGLHLSWAQGVGREFESRRPDQRKQLIYLHCRVSARLAHL